MYVYEFHVVNCVLRILIGLEQKNSKCTSGSVTVSQENRVYCGVKIKIFVRSINAVPVVPQCHKRTEL